jgi:hypothetical protein
MDANLSPVLCKFTRDFADHCAAKPDEYKLDVEKTTHESGFYCALKIKFSDNGWMFTRNGTEFRVVGSGLTVEDAEAAAVANFWAQLSEWYFCNHCGKVECTTCVVISQGKERKKKRKLSDAPEAKRRRTNEDDAADAK